MTLSFALIDQVMEYLVAVEQKGTSGFVLAGLIVKIGQKGTSGFVVTDLIVVWDRLA